MRPLRSVLVNRDYARLWYGQIISTFGDCIFNTTLVLWVAADLARGKPWAPAAVSGVLLAASMAVVGAGPLAGVFVDRWDRRVTMLATEVFRGILVAALTALSFLPAGKLPAWAWLAAVYAIVFLLNAAGQFFQPARIALLGEIVEGETDRARAAGLGQVASSLAAILGPPLAASLLFSVGLPWALMANAASYGVSWFAIRSVRPGAGHAPVRSGGPRPKLRQEFAAGLNVFRGNQFLVAILLIVVIAECGTGTLSALDIFFVTRNLHATAHLYGYLGTALGIGGIVGALIAGPVVRGFGARTTTVAGLFLAGLLLVAYSRQTVFLAGLLLLFCVAVPLTALITALAPLTLAVTPQEFRGRVIAVFNPACQLASMMSVVVAGWLVSSVLRNMAFSLAGLHFGPIDTIFTVAGILVMLAGGYALVGLPVRAGHRRTRGRAAPAPSHRAEGQTQPCRQGSGPRHRRSADETAPPVQR